MDGNTFNSYVKELGGLAPDFRTNMSDLPQLAAICKNFWVRGYVLRQTGKIYGYDASNDWEDAAIDAHQLGDKLLVAAGDIFPFGGIYGTYQPTPFRYVETDMHELLSPYWGGWGNHYSCDVTGTTLTFDNLAHLGDDALSLDANPMNWATPGCKFRLPSFGGATPAPWVRIESMSLAGTAPGVVTMVLNANDINGAAYSYTGASNAAGQITWLLHFGYADARSTAGKFVRMYGDFVVFVSNKLPMTVWKGNVSQGQQRFGDDTGAWDAVYSRFPNFRPLAMLRADESNQWEALDSSKYDSGALANPAYGNYGYGYGCYHSSGINILRGANAACNFMEYLVLGGTNEVLQPVGTAVDQKVVGPDRWRCSPPATIARHAVTNVAGSVRLWKENAQTNNFPLGSYDVRAGDIICVPNAWNATAADRFFYPDFTGGWGLGTTNGFYEITSVDNSQTGSGTLVNVTPNWVFATSVTKKPFHILRKRGGSYVRWCNAPANGGFTNWNPSGDHDGSYREMGWGGGDIQDIKRFGGAAWVFKRNGIGRLSYTGNYDVFRLDYVSGQIGTHGGFNSVVETPRGLFFPHGDDFYMFDGTMQSLNEPVATGHRRIWGGWGNSKDVTMYSADYDAYHHRVMMGAIVKPQDGALSTYNAIFNVDTGQWAQTTPSETLEAYDFPVYPTLVRCPTAGLRPNDGVSEESRQNYTILCTGGGGFYGCVLLDYDVTAHPNSASIFWVKYPLNTIRWKSSPFDMGYIDYKKDIHFMRMVEDSLSDTVLPTYWHRLHRSNDFVGDWSDTYAADQDQDYELRVSGNRFQYDIYGDGGQVVGFRDPNYLGGGYNYVTIGADTKIAYKVTVGSKDVVAKGVAFYGKYNAAATAKCRFGVYSDVAGVPGALLLPQEINNAVNLSKTARWHYIEFPGGITLSAATIYWFCLQAGTAAVDVAYIAGTGTMRIDAIADVYADGLSNPYGAGVSSNNQSLCLFVQSAGNTRGSGIGGIALEWTKQDRTLTIR